MTGRQRRTGSVWQAAGIGLALAGALAAVPLAGFAQTASPRGVALMNGAVRLAGPAGYCVDMQAVDAGETSVFVLLASCAALNGEGPSPRQTAVLTASVAEGAPSAAPLEDSFPEMAAFFRSEQGRAALSRVGAADSVTVQTVTALDGVMYLRIADAAAAAGGQPVEPEYWRAVFALKGRIVTLSVLGARDRPLAAPDKRRLLDAFVRAVRRANGVGG